jgi:hypothetical protein|tara:strand:+ start:230 stop:382 length:153 start_codon:yes stop_codon:yes gene_type:complete
MIEKAEIVGPYDMVGRECTHYLYIEFSDGRQVSLTEEELKNAAVIVERWM